MTIDIKLKTYEQLQFEIAKLNTDIFLKDKEIERLKGYKDLYKDLLNQSEDNIKQLIKKLNEYKSKIDKATNYYLKTLAKNGSMPDEAVDMFNLLEGNK